MKILDRYVVKNFLIGYAIAFGVLIGLRVIMDLFVNLDEFTEHASLSAMGVARNILVFYALNVTLYFRDFAGMITVVAAAFSLGKMVRWMAGLVGGPDTAGGDLTSGGSIATLILFAAVLVLGASLAFASPPRPFTPRPEPLPIPDPGTC